MGLYRQFGIVFNSFGGHHYLPAKSCEKGARHKDPTRRDTMLPPIEGKHRTMFLFFATHSGKGKQNKGTMKEKKCEKKIWGAMGDPC
jgi:hypothetical protein